MGSRGRKSTSEIATRGSAMVEREERPEPPEELTPEQAQEWRELVETLPANRITREMRGLLVEYCRHRIAARHVAEAMSQYLEHAEEVIDFDQYDKLLRMQERESRILASLAVRLGFAYSTAYEKRKQKVTPSRKPWDFKPGGAGTSGKK